MESLSQIEKKVCKDIPSKMGFDPIKEDEIIEKRIFDIVKMITRGF
jgi:hypothetical protein